MRKQSQELEKARAYEEEYAARIRPSERPLFHLSAYVGWMNDPNGFSYYDGQYHLFYQYHPYDTVWGPMHWGHAVSKDLIRWEYLPAAMAPDQAPDRDGCFSGTACVLPEGLLPGRKDARHMLMYTGIVREEGFGQRRAVQTQNLAFGDGLNYEKYEGNPVLAAEDLPEGGSPYDFRDPKIYLNEDPSAGYTDTRFSMICANDNADGGGRILLYASSDGLHWHYVSTILCNSGRIGKMWECPDLFRLDGKDVLLLSAQDMFPKDLEYHNGDSAICFLGTFDGKEKVFREESDHALDYGIDFYAPQTLLTADGRRVMIGWMQNWDTCNLHDTAGKWFGQMTFPRELSVEDGRLVQKPLRELAALRKNKAEYKDVVIRDGEITLPGVEGRVAELFLTIEAEDPGRMFRKFAFRFAQNAQYHTGLSFRPQESVLKIDRKFSGSRRAIIHQRRAQVAHENGKLALHILLDRFSAEVFIGNGVQVMSAVINTDPAAEGMSFYADGAVRISCVKYDLVL